VIANLKLGMQGWSHEEWVGRAYPTNIPSSRWLNQYSTRFPTVEVDDTFYGLPPEPLVLNWRESVEEEFTFSPKVPQQITHEQRFAPSGGLLKRFLDRVSLLNETLGPLLLIAPPGFRPDDENEATLRRFIENLPTDFSWALELKHAGWCTDETHELLASRNVALVAGTSRWIATPRMAELTERPSADFAYIRWNCVSNGRTQAGEDVDAGVTTAFWEQTLVRLCGLVDTVYGYFHTRAFGDGLRSAKNLQYSIDQRRPDESV
jgi:uncharacterized protein YecE (DUF72 family)